MEEKKWVFLFVFKKRIKKTLVSDHMLKSIKTIPVVGFSGGPVVKNPLANAGHTGMNPGLGRAHMSRGN